MDENTLALIMVVLLIVPFVLAWGWILYRNLAIHEPIFPRLEPARTAKWGAPAVCFIFCMFLLLPSCFDMILGRVQEAPGGAGRVISVIRDGGTGENPPAPGEEKTDNKTLEELKESAAHPLVLYLHENPSAMKYLFAFLVAALCVPFTEEFVFRVIVQGWLEAGERQAWGMSRRHGVGALLLTAAFFTLIHFRPAGDIHLSAERLGELFTCQLGAYFLLLAVSFVVLRVFCRATWRDIGMDFRHWRKDILLGCLAYAVVALPTGLMMLLATAVDFNNRFGVVADPIALVPLALVLGLLYWRTHRILPCFTAHALFNAQAVLFSMMTSLRIDN